MTAAKPVNPTVSHLLNPAFADSNASLKFDSSAHSPRLVLKVGLDIPNAWANLQHLVRSQPQRRLAIFPDTNIRIKHEARDFWNGLRLFHLEHKIPRAMISAPIYGESQKWMLDPWDNKDLAVSLREALHDPVGGWAQFVDFPKDVSIRNALIMYVRLLGFRRQLLDCACDGMLDGTTRTKCEAMNYLKNSVGERGQMIAKKGSVTGKGKFEYSLCDEAHVLLAIFFGICTGIETVIVTTDRDLLEIFFKAQWFLDTHYRAMLAADFIDAGKWPGEPIVLRDLGEKAFRGDVKMFPHVSPTFREVLPPVFEPVSIHCFYIHTDGTATHLIFVFEREVQRLMRMKSENAGRCTNRFGASNIHINMGPLGDEYAGHVGIAADIAHQVPGCDIPISHLDVLHAINSQERHDWAGTLP